MDYTNNDPGNKEGSESYKLHILIKINHIFDIYEEDSNKENTANTFTLETFMMKLYYYFHDQLY